MIHLGGTLARIGGNDGDRVVTDFFQNRVETEFAGGIQLSDVQIRMRCRDLDVGIEHRSGSHFHDITVGGSVCSDCQIQRDFLGCPVQHHLDGIIPAIGRPDNDIEQIIPDGLYRCIIAEFTGFRVHRIAVILAVDGDRGTGTNNDFDGGHLGGDCFPERIRCIQRNGTQGNVNRIGDGIHGLLRAVRGFQEGSQGDFHGFLQRSRFIVVPGMIRNFNGGKAIDNNVADVKLPDVNGIPVIAGNQNGMGSQVILHGGEYPGSFIMNRLKGTRIQSPGRALHKGTGNDADQHGTFFISGQLKRHKYHQPDHQKGNQRDQHVAAREKTAVPGKPGREAGRAEPAG